MLSRMGSPVVLRQFTPVDQVAVRALVLAGLGEHWGHVDESLNHDLDDIARSFATGRTIVAVTGDRIVGTGTVMPAADRSAEIVRMSVERAQRRNGVGRCIAEHLVDVARGWGCSRVVLETTSAWHGAVAFYLSCDFVVTHCEGGEYGDGTWFERLL